MSRTALDLARISEGTEDQVAKVALQTFQDQITSLRAADMGGNLGRSNGTGRADIMPAAWRTEQGVATPGADDNFNPLEQVAGTPKTRAIPLSRAQMSLLDAMKGFETAKNPFEGMKKFGPTFETAIKQADEDFTTKMTAMAKDYEASKPAVEKADKEMTAAETALSASLRGIKDPQDKQAAAALALQYMMLPDSDKAKIDLDKVFKPYPEVAQALLARDKAATENAPILKKMDEWRTNTEALVMDKFMTRVAYGSALDSMGAGSRAQEQYKAGFGVLGLPVPKQLLPKRDPNIREA